MGLWDKIKGKAEEAINQAQARPSPAAAAAAPPPPPARHEEPEVEEEPDTTEEMAEEGSDLAGFDPDDEDAFFEAVLHMESEGQFGGTDESRAEIMRKYGIRDRMHWQTVKDSVYGALVQKYGSSDQVSQREMNFRMGQMQRHMQAQVAQRAASGEMNPVEGVTLEAWAAFNASIVQGASLDDLLKGAGIDRPRWDRVTGEWNARMARDTTGAIATVYGNAFQNASKGKYGAHAREANAARAENRELKMEPPMSLEQYYEVMYEQAYAAKEGRDAAQALKSMGLSIVDWTDLSSYMGYFFHRTAGLKWKEYEATFKRVEAKFAAKYPGVKPDLDIKF